MRLAFLVLASCALLLPAVARAGDWLRFGYDAQRSSAPAGASGITPSNVGSLTRLQVPLEGAADSAAAYVQGALVEGGRHDTFFVTTNYGRTYAIDADSGAVLWRFVPPGIAAWDHTALITESSPLVDADREHLYAAAPDGKIHKLAVADGTESTAGNWPATVTLDPKHEKIASALNMSRGLLLVAVGSFFGYAPFVGHVVALDHATGRIANVFNTSCSNRHALIDPKTCDLGGPGLWGRGGVVVEPGSGRLLIATANGSWNGRTLWGDSVLELSPDAGRLLQSYTPANADFLEGSDLDLGSSAPALLTPHLVLQGSKDGRLRLLDLDRLNGRDRKAGRKGGELQTLAAPRRHQVLSAPAVWRSGGKAWTFVANYAGTAAYQLVPGTKPRLRIVWQNRTGGSSPVVAGGLLYVYSPLAGGLHVYRFTTGKAVATLPAGTGHWNSPIVVDGRIALPEGSANAHHADSVLDIYRLPRSPSD